MTRVVQTMLFEWSAVYIDPTMISLIHTCKRKHTRPLIDKLTCPVSHSLRSLWMSGLLFLDKLIQEKIQVN